MTGKMRIFRNNVKEVLERMAMILFLSFFTSVINAQSNIDFLKKIQEYQDFVKTERTEQFPDLIDTSTFNIVTYLQFFDKLILSPDLECHYLFIDERTGGCPVLYVNSKSFKTEKYVEQEFKKYIEHKGIDKNKITPEFEDFKKYEILCGFATDSINLAKNNLTPKDGKDGYLQFLFFNNFGEEFAFKWHSNYGQKSVIFSNDEINRLYNYYLDTDLFSCDMEKFEKLLNLNPSPIIKMKKRSCLITWYEIATHHGIYKRSYEISRSAPYTIEKKEDVEMLKINTEFIY